MAEFTHAAGAAAVAMILDPSEANRGAFVDALVAASEEEFEVTVEAFTAAFPSTPPTFRTLLLRQRAARLTGARR